MIKQGLVPEPLAEIGCCEQDSKVADGDGEFHGHLEHGRCTLQVEEECVGERWACLRIVGGTASRYSPRQTGRSGRSTAGSGQRMDVDRQLRYGR